MSVAKETNMESWPYIFIGLALVAASVLSKKSFINDIEMPATEDEIRKTEPSLAGRIVVASAGVASIVYGLIVLIKEKR